MPECRKTTRALTWAFAFALTQAAGTTAALGQTDQDDNGFLGSLFEGDENAQNDGFQNEGAPFNNGDESVAVNDDFFVELHVNDDDLATVLQMLSIQSQRNIVTSANVSATVTANLYGVTFYEALDAILHVNGFGYIENGNFIYVYTRAELEEIMAAARTPVSRVLRLDYLNAVDAAEFVAPLLSEVGAINTNGETSDFQLGDQGPVGKDDYALDAMMVVHDYEENVNEIEQLIGQIDTRPAQVLVEATILQSELNENNAFGIDFSLVTNLDIADFVGGPLGAADSLLGGIAGGETVSGDASATSSNIGNQSGPSTLKAGVIEGDFALFLRVLDEVSDTTILSNPKILSLNRQPARVLVGRKVGYLSTTSTDTATTQTVEFLDTGTQLYFRPFVSTDGQIRMELKPQVSEAVIRQVTDAGGAAVTIPDEVTNELTANVMVRDGQTVVLGGLFRESTIATRRQIPVLGDIPIVGSAFRGQEDEIRRAEVIFMVTPSIMSDEILLAQGERASDYVTYVRAGSREGMLIFSREKQSAQLLVRAQKLAREGKTQRALHCIQRALELKPTNHEAIALRAALLNKNPNWPEGSMLHDIITGETDTMVGFDREGSFEFSPYVANKPGTRSSNPAEQEPTSETQITEVEEIEDPFDSGRNPSAGAGAISDAQDDFSDPFADFESGDDFSDPFGDEPSEPVTNAEPFGNEFEAYDTPSEDANGGFEDGFNADDGFEFFDDAATDAGATQNADGTFNLSFHREDLQTALEQFASASGREFVVDDFVAGVVSVELNNVSFENAMRVLVTSMGYEYQENGDTVHVAMAGNFHDSFENNNDAEMVTDDPFASFDEGDGAWDDTDPFADAADWDDFDAENEQSFDVEAHAAEWMDEADAEFAEPSEPGIDLTGEMESASGDAHGFQTHTPVFDDSPEGGRTDDPSTLTQRTNTMRTMYRNGWFGLRMFTPTVVDGASQVSSVEEITD